MSTTEQEKKQPGATEQEKIRPTLRVIYNMLEDMLDGDGSSPVYPNLFLIPYIEPRTLYIFIGRITAFLSDEENRHIRYSAHPTVLLHLAVIYMKRIKSSKSYDGFQITIQNVCTLFCTCIVLAIKILNDESTETHSVYKEILKCSEFIDMENTELSVCKLLEWKLHVTKEEYDTLELSIRETCHTMPMTPKQFPLLMDEVKETTTGIRTNALVCIPQAILTLMRL